MASAILREKGQLTIPEELRKRAHLSVGDTFEVEMTTEGILLRPQKVIDATQAWFWSPEWQAGEREVEVDRAKGNVRAFGSGEEFLDALGLMAGETGSK